MTNSNFDKVVGMGSYKGWTRKDFADEMRVQREVMENKNSTFEEREDALESAGSLLVRCDDNELFDGLILNHFMEMQKRHLMIMGLELKEIV